MIWNTDLKNINQSDNFRLVENLSPSKFILKFIVIVALWESLIMIILPFLKLNSIVLEVVVDTILLSIFSVLSVWFGILKPGLKKIVEKLKDETYDLEQQISAINKIANISVSDSRGKITYVNDIFCNTTGYTKEELVGRDHRIVNSKYHSKEFFKSLWVTLNEGKIWKGKVRNKKKNNEFYWADTSIIPLFDTRNSLTNFITIRFDITSEKLTEEILEKERLKNMHSSRLAALGEMATRVAHEINNPLAIIDGLISSSEKKLNRPNFENKIPKILENFEKCHKNVDRIAVTINGIRELTKPENKAELEFVTISNLLDSVENIFNQNNNNTGIKFEIDINELTARIKVRCNSIQLKQAILNIVNNSIDAVETLPEKWIKVNVISKAGFIELSVIDSGRGIQHEVAQKIMQPFFTTKEVGKGTGMGLSISKSIIENHGGTLFLEESSVNTKFVIKIPTSGSPFLDLFDLDEALDTHLGIRQKLINYILKPDDLIEAKKLSSSLDCLLGRWLEKNQFQYKLDFRFEELYSAHEGFHKYVEDIFQRVSNGEKFSQKQLSENGSDFDQLSKRVISKIKAFHDSLQTKNKAA
jgi:PAS domain S-box-containing protein